jgi:NAD(P)-dependent dehydrogenase (short-subunit alcohol dehydrogenase family)
MKGKVAVVTGAGKQFPVILSLYSLHVMCAVQGTGIGRQVCRAFAEAGATVILA